MTHYDYYLITGKKLQAIADSEYKSFKAWDRQWKKFRKDLGWESEMMSSFGDRRSIQGVLFPKGTIPDEKVWRKVDRYGSRYYYWPRKNTEAGRVLAGILDPHKYYQSSLVEKAVGYEWLHANNTVFPFNYFYYPKKAAGFLVPKLPDSMKKEFESKWYKPVPGVRKVTYETLKKKIGKELEA